MIARLPTLLLALIATTLLGILLAALGPLGPISTARCLRALPIGWQRPGWGWRYMAPCFWALDRG
jgi:hypothetical protein